MDEIILNEGEVLAWHFLPENRHLRHDSQDVLVEAGYTYYIEETPVMCRRGMHASISPLDALGYFASPVISRVILSGGVEHGDDKVVAQCREVLWVGDISDVLGEFARWSALSVAHLWDIPDGVRQWLETGDENLRSAAESAAESAARSAAWSAAESAAWSAAESAARSAAWSAAWSAAESAAWSAAWSAAESAAWSAARSAARSAQSDKFEQMLLSYIP